MSDLVKLAELMINAASEAGSPRWLSLLALLVVVGQSAAWARAQRRKTNASADLDIAAAAKTLIEPLERRVEGLLEDVRGLRKETAECHDERRRDRNAWSRERGQLKARIAQLETEVKSLRAQVGEAA